MTTSSYRYPIEECDIPTNRRPALESFRARRAKWVQWLDDDPHFSIWDALSSMVWADNTFRIIGKVAQSSNSNFLLNSLVAEKMIQGHATTMILAIRRLMDEGTDVISIRRLIKEMRKNWHLFTRENYVCFDGLSFDYEAAMHAEIIANQGQPFFRQDMHGPKAWATSARVHAHFDKITGINENDRQRGDRLPIRLLDTIEEWIENSEAKKIQGWSHTFLAHAGQETRRAAFAEYVITNDAISKCIKDLSRAAEGLSSTILYSSGRTNGLMPTAQFDILESMGVAPRLEDIKPDIQELWHSLSCEGDNYPAGVEEELIKVIADKR